MLDTLTLFVSIASFFSLKWRQMSGKTGQFIFVQQCVQADINGNIKARVTGLLRGEYTDDQWVPLTKGQ